MKQITRYQADDGAIFDSENACVAHESLCSEIDNLMRRLPSLPKDDGCKFANGHGFIQHEKDVFLFVRKSLLELANKQYPHKWLVHSIKDETVHPSWAGRIIGEISMPLERAWNRIVCTDKQYREWGQPYCAANPDKAEQFCINARATND